jgi:hypothetical protein
MPHPSSMQRQFRTKAVEKEKAEKLSCGIPANANAARPWKNPLLLP